MNRQVEPVAEAVVTHADDRVTTMVEQPLVVDKALVGGLPLLNCSVDGDDPVLQDR